MAKPTIKGQGLAKNKRPAHRPPFKWTYEMESEIMTRIMGGESIMDICGVDRDDWLPSETTFYKRLSTDTAFAEKYARAREAQAHREADEIRAIADMATPEGVQVARLQIDARKWRASKLAPKVYGDKQSFEHSGPDGGPIQTEEVTPRERILGKLNRLSAGSGDGGGTGGSE
jgi:hypothetical protein